MDGLRSSRGPATRTPPIVVQIEFLESDPVNVGTGGNSSTKTRPKAKIPQTAKLGIVSPEVKLRWKLEVAMDRQPLPVLMPKVSFGYNRQPGTPTTSVGMAPGNAVAKTLRSKD